MNYFDYLLLAILALSVVSGFTGGFARGGIGFIATVCGILFGFWFYGVPAAFFGAHIHSRLTANLLGFLVVFLLFVLAGSLVSWALAKLFRWTGLSWLDRLIGAAFGFVRGVILLAAFVAVIMAFAPRPLPTLVNSRLLPDVLEVSDILADAAPHELEDSFHDAVTQIKRIWAEHVRQHKESPPLKVEEQ